MKRVIIESPYAGDVELNIEYAKACVRDSLARGEAPLATHLFYTQDGILNDDVCVERASGMLAGSMWAQAADMTAVYLDRGISYGMSCGIEHAKQCGREIEYRNIEQGEGRDSLGTAPDT